MVRRLVWLLLAVTFASGSCRCSKRPGADPHRAAMERAATYLWAKQGADGGWHSDVYGLMGSGQSLTPFVLRALLVSPVPRRPEQVAHAEKFMLAHLDARGCLGNADPELADYPNYATGLALSALALAGRVDQAQPLVGCLREQQYQEAHGWQRTDDPYGGWGMGGEVRKAPHAGHVDLSMTRSVVEGLAAAGLKLSDPSFARAELFVTRCRNPDGGFVYSRVDPEANKAGAGSYGTATADGVLTLLALGVPRSDPRIKHAVTWLIAHHRADVAPGIPPEHGTQWDHAMRFYYRAASAEVLSRLQAAAAPPGRDWRRDMVDALVASQQKDGSWRNENVLQKEDDPLIATAFALIALSYAVEATD